MWWVTSWDEVVSRDLCIYAHFPRFVIPQNSRTFPLEVAEPYGEFKLRQYNSALAYAPLLILALALLALLVFALCHSVTSKAGDIAWSNTKHD